MFSYAELTSYKISVNRNYKKNRNYSTETNYFSQSFDITSIALVSGAGDKETGP